MVHCMAKKMIFSMVAIMLLSCNRETDEKPIIFAEASIENNVLTFQSSIYDWPKHRFFANTNITNLDLGKMYHVSTDQYSSPDRTDGKYEIFKLQISLAQPALHTEPIPFYQNVLYRIDYTIDSPGHFGGPRFRGAVSCYLIHYDKTGLKSLLDSTQKRVNLLTTTPIVTKN